MIWEAVILSGVIILTILFYRDTPPTLPSIAAD